ncbi:ABC transporter B family member 29, chloroplastic [Glycine soja]
MMMQMLVLYPFFDFSHGESQSGAYACFIAVVAFLGQELRKVSKEAHVLPAILFVKANNEESCKNTRFKRLALVDYTARQKKKKMKALIPQIIQAIYFGVLSILKRFICDIVAFLDSANPGIYCYQGSAFEELSLDVGKAYNECRQGEPAAERLLAMSRTGETVAIVGPSGGGKTTLVKLLLPLYDPISVIVVYHLMPIGCILINNHNIQNIGLASLRRHTLFSGTVAANIGYRDLTTKIDMDRVKHASETAHADEFVKKLPEGYKINIRYL